MSNRRRLKSDRPGGGPRCAACGRRPRAGRQARPLPGGGGGVVCGRCLDAGAVQARLGCGHLGIPGVMVSGAPEPGLSRCASCCGELTLTGRVLGTGC